MPYLAAHPPTHIMLGIIAGALGWKPRRPGDSLPKAPTGSDFAELAQIGIGMTGQDVHEGLPMPVLDFAALKAQGRA